MKLELKTPKGYRRLRVGARPRKSDLEPKYWSSETGYGASWEPIGWSSGVDDYRVDPGMIIIRKMRKR